MATLALTAALVLPFHAHTVTELEQWQADWNSRAMHSLDVGMMDERRDMRARHRWYFDPEPEVQVAARVVSSAPPPPNIYGPGVEQWRGLVQTYWPAELVEWALRIIDCESHGNPSARNPISSAAGLFQFLRSTWDNGPAPALGLGSYDSGAVYDPESNIRAAAWLYANWGGKSQWSCRA